MAIRLSREFGHVLYYRPWKSSFPSSNDYLVGEGIDEIEKIEDFWEHVEEADIIAFFDIYDADLQEELIRRGKIVWGGRQGEEIELDRWGTKQLLQKLGLPVNKSEQIIGLPALREYLKEHENVFIKVSKFRGDGETWRAVNYKLAEPMLDELEHSLGAKKLIQEFIVEEAIDAVCEAGTDTFCIDGKYPNMALAGIEVKDMGYGGHVKQWKDLSPLLTDYNIKIAPTLELYKYRQFMSSEIRVTKDGIPYMIDATQRLPAPPNELMQEMIKNLGEIIWNGAQGILVEPQFEAEYGVEIIIRSSWAEKNWQSIYYPKEIERWVKLKNVCKIKNTTYVIPQHFDLCEIGAVVATGTSMENAVENVKEYIKQIEGIGLSMETESIMEKFNKQAEDMKLVGIIF